MLAILVATKVQHATNTPWHLMPLANTGFIECPKKESIITRQNIDLISGGHQLIICEFLIFLKKKNKSGVYEETRKKSMIYCNSYESMFI